jgi:hypothetical protein
VGEEKQTFPRQILHALSVGFYGIAQAWRALAWAFKSVATFVVGFLLFFLIPFLIGMFVLSTPRDQAYRNFHVALPLCQDGLRTGWTVLAESEPKEEKGIGGEWIDASNDETHAVAKDSIWGKRLRCSLQRHVIPVVGDAADATKKPVEYYLGFLEYKENGEPYSLVQDGVNGDETLSTDFLEKTIPAKDAKPTIDQLDVLRRHLGSGSNYVIAFVHGWRHDASIGDRNVADLRHYAAHTARFLAERCEFENLYCDTKVTAIYVGWRGARVDENGMRITFGRVGEYIAQFAAGATLFDRKPVSERIAPGVISALRTIEAVLSDTNPNGTKKLDMPLNKMVVFGHSLGGNMLMTGLQGDLIKLVRRHQPAYRLQPGNRLQPGDRLPPVLGQLVILINPASEASKWTAVQREVWNRIPFRLDGNTTMDALEEGHKFFPVDQKPVIISVTSALAFPAGGLRDGDCEWINLTVDDKYTKARKRIKEDLEKSEGMFAAGIEYDTATHVLFPTFKLDFRPLAEWFDRLNAKIEGGSAPGQTCKQVTPAWYRRMASLPTRLLAGLFRTLPFQNTDQESSHTIGNLDPPRPALGILAEYLTSAAPFGTTHELIGSSKYGEEKHNDYSTLSTAPVKCLPANNWLRRARLVQPNGTFWDSSHLGPESAGGIGQGHPAAQLLHGFNLGGTAAITRANDPFWNIRAFDNALSKHDGFRLSSFICTMHQFVMDDITTSIQSIPNTIERSLQPPPTAVPN